MGVVGRQSFEKVGEDLLFDVQVVAVRVERERLAPTADAQLVRNGAERQRAKRRNRDNERPQSSGASHSSRHSMFHAVFVPARV